MKNSKIAKFGIISLAAITLSVVAPVVTSATFSSSVVYAEEQNQNTRLLNVMDSATDEKGNYLPDVDLGLSQVVNVTPEKPYVVNQPEIKGWERDGIFYTKEGGSSLSKAMKNGEQIVYDDLFEDKDNKDSYGGILIYSYKRSQPTTPVQPDTPAEKPKEEPSKPDAPATKPDTPAEKPKEEPSKPDAPATKPDTPAEKPKEEPSKPDAPATKPDTPAEKPKEEPSKPDAPATKPDTPAEKPKEEPSKPDAPATKPDTPAEKPKEEPSKPDAPATKPDTPAEKPKEEPSKPATKPTDNNKPVVKPADTGKPEVKPVQQTGTAVANAQTPAPKADAKAAASAAENKMETLPNTGESDNSTLLTLGATMLAFVVAKLSFRKKS